MVSKTVVIFILIVLALDIYVFKGINQLYSQFFSSGKKTFAVFYIISALVIYGLWMYCMLHYGNASKLSPGFFVFCLGLMMVVFIPKLIFAVFHLIDDIAHAGQWGVNKLNSPETLMESRRNFISKIGLGAAAIMFGGLTYGIIRGKFNFSVFKEDILSSKIPKSFDGCKIVQISDAHLGSFVENFEPVRKAIKMINELNPDYVVFTGDLVNNNAIEAAPWVDVFAEIKAKKGKYSIFGNHDYADYGRQSNEAKVESIRLLKEIHAKMGFKLLEDENVTLTAGDETISLIGVHNWGKGFHQVGDLTKALKGVPADNFKILLSHDPTHFDYKVKGKTDIDLTLSGHTHGMQMGIEIPSLNIKWSPVKWRYKKWAGLYEENGQKLYINRGLGVLAYPGRLGISPEITLLNLKSTS